MKFSSTVDSLSQENRHLRRVILFLGFGIVLLALAVLTIYDRPPKLVLRSSRGLEFVNLTTLERTQADAEQAVRLMLKARLDSNVIAPEVYLSQRQMELRNAEQRELKSRQLSQSIIVRGLEMREGAMVANFDRVISFGDIRSAIQTRASIAFEEIEPNELNPYGIRMSTLVPIEPQTKGATAPGTSPSSNGSSQSHPKKGDGK